MPPCGAARAGAYVIWSAPCCWPSPGCQSSSRRGLCGWSAYGTKRNCQDPHGISGAEGRPAVPSAWRRQPPLTPEPTFTKTQSRGSGWVERLSASVFFSMTATRRFRPSTRPTSGPRPIAVIRRSYLVTPIEPERSTKFSLATSHKRWRRRRPAALPVQCPIRRSVLRKGSTACS